jgi:hypothetical protein
MELLGACVELDYASFLPFPLVLITEQSRVGFRVQISNEKRLAREREANQFEI